MSKNTISQETNHTITISCILFVSIGLKKKIRSMGKNKGYEMLQKWERSIINHIYWCAKTSATPKERVAKWNSIVNHICNIHSGHSELFPACLHGELGARLWFERGKFL